MKHVRKALALMLATFIALVIAAPAFAADHSAGGTGTDINKIIVDNSEVGSKYSLIQVFQGTADAANQQQANPYKPMTYILTDAQKNKLDSTHADYDQDSATFFNQWFKITNDYNVEVKDEAAFKTYIESEAGNKAFCEFAEDFGTEVVQEFTATEGTITFTNVPYGYYVVKTDTGTDAQHPDAIVTIDSSTPVETHVIDKNVVTDIKKIIKSQTINGATIDSTSHTNSAALDEVITFEVTADAKNYEGTKKMTTYFIEDTMDPEFSIIKDSLKVEVGGVELDPAQNVTGGTVKQYTLISGGTEGDSGFVIEVPWTTDQTKAGTHLYAATDTIVVTYQAKLDPAKVKDNYKPSNNNKATLKPVGDNTTVDHDPPTGTDFPEDDTTTYETGITIEKEDDAGNKLEGAVFTLTRTDGGDLVAAIIESSSSTPTYVPWTTGTKYWKSSAAASGYTTDDPATLKDGVDPTDPNFDATDPANYKFDWNAYDEWTSGMPIDQIPVYEQQQAPSGTTITAKGKGQGVTSITATTDANGIATFAALGPGEYKIEETTVPPGYIKAADRIYTVTYDSSTHQFTWTQTAPTPASAAAGTQTPAVDALAETTIVDPQGTEFPETGGMGTRILYTVGGLMVAGAAIYLITKKRMASEA